jgi:hypothetical protein
MVSKVRLKVSRIPKCEFHCREYIRAVVLLGVNNELTEAFVNYRIKEGHVMEPNGTAQYEFEHMSIQINWTEFILKEAEAHQSVEIKK